MSENREPVVVPLPEGCTEVERIEIIKAVDQDGELFIQHSATSGLRSWEAIGMLTYTVDTLRRALLEGDDDE